MQTKVINIQVECRMYTFSQLYYDMEQEKLTNWEKLYPWTLYFLGMFHFPSLFTKKIPIALKMKIFGGSESEIKILVEMEFTSSRISEFKLMWEEFSSMLDNLADIHSFRISHVKSFALGCVYVTKKEIRFPV